LKSFRQDLLPGRIKNSTLIVKNPTGGMTICRPIVNNSISVTTMQRYIVINPTITTTNGNILKYLKSQEDGI
jgi:hypothetical protein